MALDSSTSNKKSGPYQVTYCSTKPVRYAHPNLLPCIQHHCPFGPYDPVAKGMAGITIGSSRDVMMYKGSSFNIVWEPSVGLGLSGAFLTFLFSFLTWAVYPRKSGEEEGVGVTGKVGMSGGDEIVEGGQTERPPRRITRFDSYHSDDVLLDVTNGRGMEEESSVDASGVANGDKGQQVHISEGDGGWWHCCSVQRKMMFI
eukprot:Em0005g711a